MKRIITILILMLASIGTAMATTESINLCQKVVNEGNSWGICDMGNTSIAKAVFIYNTTGFSLVFDAEARGLIPNTNYSLIYYKDADVNHTLPSTINVNILATTKSNGNGDILFGDGFSGDLDIGNIPAIDDVNPKGKIWIINTSEIDDSNHLKWTGYANGTLMGYLFETDSINQTNGDEWTVQERMGGIKYTKITTSSGTVVRTANKNYINLSDSNDSVIINLTMEGDFFISRITEVIPNDFNMTILSPNVVVASGESYQSVKINNVSKSGNYTTYEMNTIFIHQLQYSITLNKSVITSGTRTYDIHGIFLDDGKYNGIITGSENIILSDDYDTVLYLKYDTNPRNNRLSRDEMFTAVVYGYFGNILAFGDIVKIINKYYDGTVII